MRALPCVSTLNELLIYSEREKRMAAEERGKSEKLNLVLTASNKRLSHQQVK